MSGRNRYFEVQSQYRNLRESFEKRAGLELATASRKPAEPCIFLSHRSTDKAAVRKIGEYIMSQGIDVYLDADDVDLQRADRDKDHKAITAAIELALANSTDLLVFVTTNSQDSKWIPYEIGFAKRNRNELAAMKGKDLGVLPSYLEIIRPITGIKPLNDYLKEVLKRNTSGTLNFTKIARAVLLEAESTGPMHPLTPYLSQF